MRLIVWKYKYYILQLWRFKLRSLCKFTFYRNVYRKRPNLSLKLITRLFKLKVYPKCLQSICLITETSGLGWILLIPRVDTHSVCVRDTAFRARLYGFVMEEFGIIWFEDKICKLICLFNVSYKVFLLETNIPNEKITFEGHVLNWAVLSHTNRFSCIKFHYNRLNTFAWKSK